MTVREVLFQERRILYIPHLVSYFLLQYIYCEYIEVLLIWIFGDFVRNNIFN